MQYKDFMLRTARQASEIMISSFGFQMEKQHKEEDGSPLTAADTAINRLVIESVKKQYPEHGVFGEEESDLSGSNEYVWVCDPIDGTIPFSHGISLSTFSLALVKDGEPIAGIIADPFRENYFFAGQEEGAYLNDRPIRVSKRDVLPSSLVFAENWKQSLYNVLPVVEALEDMNCHVPIYKSIAFGGALVALGEAAGIIYPGRKPWDTAALKIIVEEAGGKVTDFAGQAQRYDKEINGCIASNGLLHDELVLAARKAVLR